MITCVMFCPESPVSEYTCLAGRFPLESMRMNSGPVVRPVRTRRVRQAERAATGHSFESAPAGTITYLVPFPLKSLTSSPTACWETSSIFSRARCDGDSGTGHENPSSSIARSLHLVSGCHQKVFEGPREAVRRSPASMGRSRVTSFSLWILSTDVGRIEGDLGVEMSDERDWRWFFHPIPRAL